MSRDCPPPDSLGFLLADATRAIRKRFEQRGAEMGISASQWRVLVQIVRNGPLAQARLAELLEVEPISVSRLIDRMQDGGWVHRYSAPDDRRIKMVDLTPKTRTAFTGMRDTADRIYAEALQGVSDADRDTTRTVLLRLIQNLSMPIEGENDL